MQRQSVRAWVSASPRRASVLMHLAGPSTATHLARRTGISRAGCSRVLSDATQRKITVCLNPSARRSRVYGLTQTGLSAGASTGTRHRGCTTRTAAWADLGWVCFRHRSAILRALSQPMQPAEIKRRARIHDPTLRMSAGNVRDVIKLMLARGIVAKVFRRKLAHPQYELTEGGHHLRELLVRTEALP